MMPFDGTLSFCNERSRLTIVLGVVLLAHLPLNVSADELLHEGTWKGNYVPGDLGQAIDATFEVTKNDDRPPWTVTMQLELDSALNDKVTFDDIQTERDAMTFSLSIDGFRRDCVLEKRVEVELFFRCTPEDGVKEHAATLTMRPKATEPE